VKLGEKDGYVKAGCIVLTKVSALEKCQLKKEERARREVALRSLKPSPKDFP
jgi:hypothetical protein